MKGTKGSGPGSSSGGKLAAMCVLGGGGLIWVMIKMYQNGQSSGIDNSTSNMNSASTFLQMDGQGGSPILLKRDPNAPTSPRVTKIQKTELKDPPSLAERLVIGAGGLGGDVVKYGGGKTWGTRTMKSLEKSNNGEFARDGHLGLDIKTGMNCDSKSKKCDKECSGGSVDDLCTDLLNKWYSYTNPNEGNNYEKLVEAAAIFNGMNVGGGLTVRTDMDPSNKQNIKIGNNVKSVLVSFAQASPVLCGQQYDKEPSIPNPGNPLVEGLMMGDTSYRSECFLKNIVLHNAITQAYLNAVYVFIGTNYALDTDRYFVSLQDLLIIKDLAAGDPDAGKKCVNVEVLKTEAKRTNTLPFPWPLAAKGIENDYGEKCKSWPFYQFTKWYQELDMHIRLNMHIKLNKMLLHYLARIPVIFQADDTGSLVGSIKNMKNGVFWNKGVFKELDMGQRLEDVKDADGKIIENNSVNYWKIFVKKFVDDGSFEDFFSDKFTNTILEGEKGNFGKAIGGIRSMAYPKDLAESMNDLMAALEKKDGSYAEKFAASEDGQVFNFNGKFLTFKIDWALAIGTFVKNEEPGSASQDHPLETKMKNWFKKEFDAESGKAVWNKDRPTGESNSDYYNYCDPLKYSPPKGMKKNKGGKDAEFLGEWMRDSRFLDADFAKLGNNLRVPIGILRACGVWEMYDFMKKNPEDGHVKKTVEKLVGNYFN